MTSTGRLWERITVLRKSVGFMFCYIKVNSVGKLDSLNIDTKQIFDDDI